MSHGARIFFVGSVILTGITVFGVNYFIDEEKKVMETLILIYLIKKQHPLEKTIKYFCRYISS
jgi:hypothetical protein